MKKMTGPSDLDETTRSEWAALGFFYEYDEPSRVWRIRASHAGVGRLASELRRYGQDPGNAAISEHEHYGPYGYLKFVTWKEPKILPDGIYGRPDDFERLAEIVATTTKSLAVGGRVVVDQMYSSGNEASLDIAIEADDFDVASADTAISGEH